MTATMDDLTFRLIPPAKRRAISLIGHYMEPVKLSQVVGVSKGMADELVLLGYATKAVPEHYTEMHYGLTELGQLVDAWNRGYRYPALP